VQKSDRGILRAGHPVAAQRSPSRSYVLAALRALHLDADPPRQYPGTYREDGRGREQAPTSLLAQRAGKQTSASPQAQLTGTCTIAYCGSVSRSSIFLWTARMKSSTPRSPVTSDSTMQSIGLLAIVTLHTTVERSVAAVVDRKDSHNRMRIAVGFRGVGVMVLIVDAGRAAHFVVNRAGPARSLRPTGLPSEEAR
jgi:uncharacterized membrane protein